MINAKEAIKEYRRVMSEDEDVIDTLESIERAIKEHNKNHEIWHHERITTLSDSQVSYIVDVLKENGFEARADSYEIEISWRKG